MAEDTVKIRYDGPALEGHSMDVNHLAPALLALGDLCKLANRKVNGDRASVRVLVRADVDQNCFEVQIQLAQTIIEQVKTFIKHDEIKTAKEILEWLGIIGGVTYTTGKGFFALLKWQKNRVITSKEIVKKDGKDLIEIHCEGDNNTITVFPQTVEIYEDPQAIKAAQEIVKPLSEEGYDLVEFEYDGDNSEEGKIVEKIEKEDALKIIEVDPDAFDEIETVEEPQIASNALLKVYSPVFDPKKPKWKFDIGGKIESVDISETTIAEDALSRGKVSPDDIYKVNLEIQQVITKNKQVRLKYKIIKVIKFIETKRHTQGDLFSDESKGSKEEGKV